MSQAVKRACDACHRRKVKCDGINPCRNCSSAQLSCTYNAIPQKKGPKGSRAKVISELRETQRQTSLTAKVHNRMNGIPSPPEPMGGAPTPGMLSPELVKDCLDFYFANLYEKAPVLDRRRIEQQLPYMEQNRDTYCLLTALCGFMVVQPGMALPLGDYNLDMYPGADLAASQVLLEECLRVRRGHDYLDSPTLDTLATSFFIFAIYQSIELHDKAWFYLREATTMVHLSGMNKEDTYGQWDATESSRRRRLYWLFFVLERAHAIQRQRPLTLQASIKPPSSADDPTDPQAHQLTSFIMLVKLFHSFDDAFTSSWNKTRSNLPHQHIATLQKQLADMLPTYLCQDDNLSNLHTNQQWLKSTHWQLSNGSMSSHNADGIDWQVPRDLSRDLLMKMASQFPGQGMELLGSGLIEKVFEIGSNMMDFLVTQPASRDPFSLGPREQLNQILNIVGVMRNGNNHVLPLLFTKINDVLPRLTNLMLQNAPENCALANIDIFDGPTVMSPGMEFPRQHQNDFCAPIPEQVMSPVGQSMSGSSSMNFQSMQQHQQQQQQQQSHQQHQHHNHMLQSQYMSQHATQHSLPQSQSMNGFNSPSTPSPPGMNTASMPTAHSMSQGLMNQMPRQPPQRTNSFAMPQQGQVRTVGDFHALQRSNTGDLTTMAGMGGGDMDYGGMR
ncbi:C6 zinc finger protein [Verticillium alfalfae VaMs.102]|uniref:C6 zinc finger protein n=1 Tax=Verticillium alfalfae (strain VaMs.102 / ATCC MYA-4576 / FGSC 10136) TaxID=526221 RepID=C9SXA2_VERA1|nr:C6 zinc finger protein [Verticillium alfalfae VaMs.102]EEY23292.1 C6 zinc finger protein [Verticillium alfalfae VaMs.102]